MRLIDADALKNRLTALVRGGANLNYSIADEIDKALTIEPERKTGEWIFDENAVLLFDGGEYRCSVCDTSCCESYWKYCPHCGSDNGGE